MPNNRYDRREAAAALLNLAKAATDPAVVAVLVEIAADLQERAGDLPSAVTQEAPSVQVEPAAIITPPPPARA